MTDADALLAAAKRIATLEDLAEEVWGVLVIAALIDKNPSSEVRAAFSKVDRRLREAGLKRFPQVSSQVHGYETEPHAKGGCSE